MTTNVYVSVKNFTYVKKIIFGILLQVVGKYLASIMNDSAIMCDKIMETIKTSFNKLVQRNFNKKI